MHSEYCTSFQMANNHSNSLQNYNIKLAASTHIQFPSYFRQLRCLLISEYHTTISQALTNQHRHRNHLGFHATTSSSRILPLPSPNSNPNSNSHSNCAVHTQLTPQHTTLEQPKQPSSSSYSSNSFSSQTNLALMHDDAARCRGPRFFEGTQQPHTNSNNSNSPPPLPPFLMDSVIPTASNSHATRPKIAQTLRKVTKPSSR